MKKALILVAVGLFIFAVCYFLVYRVGAQFIKTAPSTESVINVCVPIISLLMAAVALLKIHDLFYPKGRRR